MNYLFELVFRLVDSGDVGESNFVRILSQQLGAALAEGHRLAAADLHLAHEENPQRRQHQHREPLHQRDHPPRIALGRLGRDFDALLAELLDQVRIFRRVSLEMLTASGVELDLVALNSRECDLAFIDLIQEVGEHHFLLARLLPAENVEQQEEHQPEH